MSYQLDPSLILADVGKPGQSDLNLLINRIVYDHEQSLPIPTYVSNPAHYLHISPRGASNRKVS